MIIFMTERNVQGANHPSDEYIDLINGNDVVVGKELRSVVYKEGFSNFRVVNGFFRNEAGQFWIPRRQSNKTIFPNALDFSIGEHVKSGESYAAAIKRGAQEETNVDTDVTGYQFVGKLTPEHDGTAAFMQVYEIPLEKEPVYNPDDFSESFWLFPDELKRLLVKGEPAKSDLSIVMNKLYS